MGAASAASSSSLLLAPGATVGRYRLLRRLALGGMAELFLARAEGAAGFQKVVVLKRVLPNLALDEDFTAMFLDEARIAATLDHPNIASVIDLGEAEGEYYYVMEYVHGQNLSAVLKAAVRAEGLPLEVAIALVAQAAEGLHYAHDRVGLDGRPLGLVHRDVSPSNVLVGYEGSVKITDFGIAKASARSARTRGSVMKGKIGYMSPEQCRGARVDRRSDVFALGIILYELTTLQRLFYADNDFAVLNKIVSGAVDPPSTRVPGYPPELERIVMRALAPEAEARYASARALRTDLEDFARTRGLAASTIRIAETMELLFGRPPYPYIGYDASSQPVVAAVEPRPRSNPRRWLWGLGAIVIVAGALGAGFAIGARGDGEPRPVDDAPASIPIAEPTDETPPVIRDPEPTPVEAPAIVVEPEPQSEPVEPKTKRPSRRQKKRSGKPARRDLNSPFPE
jgi:hypothetical protein